MSHLDINALNKRGLLLEGASIPCQAGIGRGRKNEALTAGVGVLYCGERMIEFERMSILGGRQSRPRFICPAGCGRGAYKLYRHTASSFACAACSGYVRPSRKDQRDPHASLLRRLAKLRLALGVRDPTMLCDLPPPPRAPRSVWLYMRRAVALRLIELKLLGVPLEDFLARRSPSEASSGSSQGDEPRPP